ncbi:MAG: universal stress protein [Thermodesulfobacteriota bacterium]
MFKEILFPVDFSPTTEEVLPFALGLAEKFGAKLHLLYVAHDLKEMFTVAVPHPALNTFTEEIKKGAQKKMKEFYDEHYNEMQGVERHVVIGDPADEIIKFAGQKGLELIVMGTHGRKGLDRVIFGSVAENVTRHSPVPVLTVNPHRRKQQ